MGYSPWGFKESDTTESITHTHRDNDVVTVLLSARVLRDHMVLLFKT